METIAVAHTDIPPRVLVVEDNPIQANILAAFVQQMGFSPVGPVSTAREALELCRYDLPHLAILDIKLAGEMDGIDLAINLRSLGKIPLVFVSGNSDYLVLQRIQKVRPVALLSKPYQPSLLQQAISQGVLMNTALFSLTPAGFTQLPTESSLFVRESNLLVRLDVTNVVSVQAVQKHAMITMASGRRHSVRLTLAEVLAHLPPADFVQCHRAWIVSLRHVEHVELSANLVHLSDGTTALLGRAYRQNIQQFLRIIG
ncbi:response regulator transcription factor [Hymenobacter sp. M29]|uniref:Response regulator transcription factor n=1 Tax=Hymenobacter mellowenesis TaxID=3063995 RepID=A0ABT9AFD9_9BACT|nr:response regulator transcription factor [Hymenobacter sp. M29]MDO7848578.1 response regulator transcription factor [Hymenobacter sp. M29]